MTKILLSICIPTYNRANQLKNTLESIVKQTSFKSSAVEVIVCDNCSSDNTQAVVEKYVLEYKDKIRYFRHNQNFGASFNCEFALQQGSGSFCKLHNDTLVLKPQSLDLMLRIISDQQSNKPILIFSNDNRQDYGTTKRCCNGNEFLKAMSYFSTWIGSFGMWKTDLNSHDDWFRESDSLLPQTDILYRELAEGREALIVFGEIYEPQNVEKKGGYNIAQVFGYNYLKILKNYVNQGIIDPHLFKLEKRIILINHINIFYFDVNQKWAFDKTGYFKWLLPDYSHEAYFYLDLVKMQFKAKVKSLKRNTLRRIFPKHKS